MDTFSLNSRVGDFYLCPTGYDSGFNGNNVVQNAPVLSSLTTPSTMSPLFSHQSSKVEVSNTLEDTKSSGNLDKNFVGYSRKSNPHVSSVSTTEAENWYRLDGGYNREVVSNRTIKPTAGQVVIDADVSVVDYVLRRRTILNDFSKKVGLLGSTEEVSLPVQSSGEKPKLGFKFLNSKFHSGKSKLETIYVKYTDRTRGRLF